MFDTLKLAESQVPKNITYRELSDARSNFRQCLHLRIFNNEIYVLNGIAGETRHLDIVEQLFDVIGSGVTLPNAEFKFYTMDTVSFLDVHSDSAVFAFWDDPFFGNLNRRILAPSCWFTGARTGARMNESPFVGYQSQIDDITSFASQQSMSFANRENSLIFKGALYPYRTAIFEDIRQKIWSTSEFLVHVKGHGPGGNVQYQNPMRNLCKYRYQLVTNGAPPPPNGPMSRLSGTCRPKYMLATGSIVLYVTDRVPRKEWWQHSKECEGLIQYCDNAAELVERIQYFEKNLDEAIELSERGIKFAKEYLHTKNVRSYWKNLLEVYASRCEFTIDCPQGTKIVDKQHAYNLTKVDPRRRT